MLMDADVDPANPGKKQTKAKNAGFDKGLLWGLVFQSPKENRNTDNGYGPDRERRQSQR
jgi:hypothetical protein